ncbi:MAG: MGH1-like glycoside hydrolase domain-containing protein [Ornithinimicrobium sp.]|uniref:MGH1-like glycoside hydrolase domain-containing protein n=1 Tax=Ornithinimicrobium sp. TaxID=1977084 RepID=UPI003D9ABEED
MSAEHDRLSESDDPRAPWRQWGPYVSARQWGTVREDYSAGGDAWEFFPFEHAHRRTYRWGEDGLAGLCDVKGYLNVGLALWNRQDDRLKERLFGLTGPQGNHGEDVKEYWWALEGTPTHSYATWLYRYPQAAFPYADLVAGNAARGVNDEEFELADTGIFSGDCFFDVHLTHAKASPSDICMEITATNHGRDAAPLHLAPQIWFRNTWSWGLDDRRPTLTPDPETPQGYAGVLGDHHELGQVRLTAQDHPQAGPPRLLFCDNETNAVGLWGEAAAASQHTAYPKDAIDRAIVRGQDDATNPEQTGTKAAFWWAFEAVPPGESVTVRLRLTATDGEGEGEGAVAAVTAFDEVLAARRAETDDFYAQVLPEGTSEQDALIARRAFAGLQWGKQLYLYDVRQWLRGDPAGPPPPPQRAHQHRGRNTDWAHVDLSEVISMPDEWEYPWFATWDLAFHCVALAHVDPAWAKWQLLLMCREWAMHPNGQLPAYEWNFSDVNPPVHPWAAWQVYAIDGCRDRGFLQRIGLKMLLNFPWWVNRKDAEGSHVFEGGFLGMDNVGLFDRSEELPGGQRLEQADATAWMGMFCLKMLRISAELAREDDAWEEVATKFLTHFLAISESMEDFGSQHAALWDSGDEFFHDILVGEDGLAHRMEVRSMVGLLPMAGVMLVPDWVDDELPEITDFFGGWVQRRPELADSLIHTQHGGATRRTLSMISRHQWEAILRALLDEGEFLSPHGFRSLSAAHRDGVQVDIDGQQWSLAYEPAESRSHMFGGNSNWRGPIWLPVNALLTDALRSYGRGAGARAGVEFPTGSGEQLPITQIAALVEQRMVAMFRPGPDGRRPSTPRHHPSGPLWDAHPTFSEYFNGDTGAGLGASHQTGWTALVAHFVCVPEGIDNR